MSAKRVGHSPFGKTYEVYAAKDIGLVLICVPCDRELSITVDTIQNGNYHGLLMFLAEHAHGSKVTRGVDLTKIRAALKLLEEALL